MNGIVVLVSALSAVAVPYPGVHDPSVLEISSTLNGFADATNQHDPRLMASAFAPNASVVTPDGQRATGHDAIESLFLSDQSSSLANAQVTIALGRIEFVSPDVALVEAGMTVAGAQRPGGPPVPDSSPQVSVVMVRQGESWMIRQATFFEALPAATRRDAPGR